MNFMKDFMVLFVCKLQKGWGMKDFEKIQEVLDILMGICVVIAAISSQAICVYIIATKNICLLAKIAIGFCVVMLSLPIVSLTLMALKRK